MTKNSLFKACVNKNAFNEVYILYNNTRHHTTVHRITKQIQVEHTDIKKYISY